MMLEVLFHHSTSNIFNGENYYDEDNHLIGHSEENVFGGSNYYDENNHMVSHSEDNIFGGHNTFDENNHMYDSTQHMFDDGEINHFNDNNTFTGHTSLNHDGGTFSDIEGEQASWHENIFGGVTMDPLSNVSSIKFPHLL